MPGFTTGVTVGEAEMWEGFMRLEGTIPDPDPPGDPGGAAIVDAELEYLLTGFSGFWSLRLLPSLASFFLRGLSTWPLHLQGPSLLSVCQFSNILISFSESSDNLCSSLL